MQRLRSHIFLERIFGMCCVCLVALAIIAVIKEDYTTSHQDIQAAQISYQSPCNSSATCDGKEPFQGTDPSTRCGGKKLNPVIAPLGPTDSTPATVDVLSSDGHKALGTLEIWYSRGCQTNWMKFEPASFLRPLCHYGVYNVHNPEKATSDCKIIAAASEFDKLGEDEDVVEKYHWGTINPGGDACTPMIYAPNNLVGGTFQISYPDPAGSGKTLTSAKTALFQYL